MEEMRVRLTFMEGILGTLSGNKELYSEYIASKAPDAKTKEEEIASLGVDGVEKKEMTVFPRTDSNEPFAYDYQIKGFFKNACKALNGADGHTKLTAYKSKIDNLIFVKERKILYHHDKSDLKQLDVLQRPLRASTPMGERVALASSEMIPAGATLEFTVTSFSKDLMKNVCEWLDYGQFNGIGQWHNGGYGRFTWEDLSSKPKAKKTKKGIVT